MDNGFGTNDILTGRGLGLYGFGGYGNGNDYLSAAAHADGTALAAKVDCGQDAAMAALERTSGQNEETRRILQGEALTNLISSNALENAILNGQQNVALADRFAKLAADQAACCCETQKLIITDGAATRDLINARALQDTQRDLDRALQDNQTQQIIAAIAAGNGGGPKSLM